MPKLTGAASKEKEKKPKGFARSYRYWDWCKSTALERNRDKKQVQRGNGLWAVCMRYLVTMACHQSSETCCQSHINLTVLHRSLSSVNFLGILNSRADLASQLLKQQGQKSRTHTLLFDKCARHHQDHSKGFSTCQNCIQHCQHFTLDFVAGWRSIQSRQIGCEKTS